MEIFSKIYHQIISIDILSFSITAMETDSQELESGIEGDNPVEKTKEDSTETNLEDLQYLILKKRIADILSTKIKGVLGLAQEDLIDQIAQQIWQDVHDHPDGFFEKIMDKLDDHLNAWIGAKILQLDSDQARRYYEDFSQDAKKIIAEITTSTDQDLESLYQKIFPKSGTSQTGLTSQNSSQATPTPPTPTPQQAPSATQPNQSTNNPPRSFPKPSSPPIIATSTVIIADQVSSGENKIPPEKKKPPQKIENNIVGKSLEVSANKFNPQITPHTPSPASSEYCWIKDKRVKINDLHQNLKAFYYDMNQKFPGLCITSGDDGKHSHGSRHYCNCAIDIGGGSSNPKAYQQFLSYLQTNSTQIKKYYDIEDVLGPRNDPKGHNDHIHIELPASATQTNRYV